MRISDWSSDVCSSDLGIIAGRPDAASRQPFAEGGDVVAGVRCRGEYFFARALVRIGQCPKHRRARAGAAEGDGRPRQAIECGSEPRGVIVADRPRRHRYMPRFHSSLARGLLNRRPVGLSRLFAVRPVADDRTEPCIGKSLHAGRIDLRGDREAVGEALRLCHEFETFRSVVNFWSSMPTSMAATNGMACTGDRASDATAGPGHRPATPQPTPNTTAPVSRCGSRSDLSGNANVSPNTRLPIRAWTPHTTPTHSTPP